MLPKLANYSKSYVNANQAEPAHTAGTCSSPQLISIRIQSATLDYIKGKILALYKDLSVSILMLKASVSVSSRNDNISY